VGQEPFQKTEVDLYGRPVVVRFVRHRRARQLILRMDDKCEDAYGVTVTIPYGATKTEALALVHDKADWVVNMLATRLPRIPFEDGVVVPLAGEDYRIRHIEIARGVVRCEGGEILVAGGPEHLGRRVKDWLKGEAKRHISPLVREKAETLGRQAGRISIRDTKSRWGSCSHEGNLSFCWRLVMAPVSVLDYVVAHEVGHLKEANHGPEFWRIVTGLTPDMENARKWLRRNGDNLQRYG